MRFAAMAGVNRTDEIAEDGYDISGGHVFISHAELYFRMENEYPTWIDNLEPNLLFNSRHPGCLSLHYGFLVRLGGSV